MALVTMSADGGQMQSGYSSSRSPIGIGGAIAVHAIVGGLFLLMPKEVYTPYVPQTFIGNQIPIDPPPPEATDEPSKAKPLVTPLPSLKPPRADPLINLPGTKVEPDGGSIIGEILDGTSILPPPLDPPHEPVLAEARIDPRALAAFQPDYPGTMVRQGVEGSVTVRVTISPEGRVTAIERLSATDEAFWIATQRHALRKWRFRPATRDGVAIGGSKVMTVHFRLADQ